MIRDRRELGEFKLDRLNEIFSWLEREEAESPARRSDQDAATVGGGDQLQIPLERWGRNWIEEFLSVPQIPSSDSPIARSSHQLESVRSDDIGGDIVRSLKEGER